MLACLDLFRLLLTFYVQKEESCFCEANWVFGIATTKNTSALRTLPRNTFSSLEQNEGAGGIGNLRTGPGGVPPPSLGERSKTLGPGFMRSHRDRMGGGSGGRVESGYISSPDGNYEFDARNDSLPHHHVPHSRDPRYSSVLQVYFWNELQRFKYVPLHCKARFLYLKQ